MKHAEFKTEKAAKSDANKKYKATSRSRVIIQLCKGKFIHCPVGPGFLTAKIVAEALGATVVGTIPKMLG